MTIVKLTPRETRVLNVLRDGQRHLRKDLIPVSGKYATRDSLNEVLSRIRAYLRPKGLDVNCVFTRKRIAYQIVRLIMPNDGSF